MRPFPCGYILSGVSPVNNVIGLEIFCLNIRMFDEKERVFINRNFGARLQRSMSCYMARRWS